MRPPYSATVWTAILLLASTASAADQPSGEPLPRGAFARLGSTRFHADEPIACMALSSDATRLAVTAHDGRALLFDAATGRRLVRFENGPMSPLLAFSRDGALLAMANAKWLSLYDTQTGKLLALLSCDQHPYKLQLSFSTDGRSLRLFDQERDNVVVVDLATRRQVREMAVGPSAWQVAFSPDDKMLAVSYRHGSDTDSSNVIKLLNLETGKTAHTIPGPFGDISLTFTPDGKTLAVKNHALVSFWDVATGKQRQRFAALDSAWGREMVLAPDGRRLAAIAGNHDIQVIATATGKQLALYRCEDAWSADDDALSPDSFAYSPAGDLVVVGHLGTTAWLWKPGKGKPNLAEGHHNGVYTLKFEDNGRRLVSTDSASIRVKQCLVANAVAQRAVFTDSDSNCIEWNLQTGQARHQPEVSDRGARGREVLYHGGAKDSLGAVQVWDRATTREVWRLTCEGVNEAQAVLSPEGRLLALSTRSERNDKRRQIDELSVWDLDANKPRWRVPTPDGWRQTLQLSADGKLLAAQRGSSTVELWDATQGRLLRTLELAENETGGPLAFSPDGHILYVGVREPNATHCIRCWATATGKQEATLANTSSRVTALALSPDGHTLAAAVHEVEVGSVESSDCQIIVWELATGRMRRQFTRVDAKATALRFSPDGRLLASAHRDTTIVLWDVFGGNQQAVEKAPPVQLQAWWTDLADLDAVKGLTAMRQLAARPVEATILIGRNLSPAKALTAAERDRWLADLDHDDFKRREEASRRLRLAGHSVAPALRQALAAKPTSEQKRRLEELLETLKRLEPNPETVRTARALEVLERIGTLEAKHVLAKLAKGFPEAPLTRDAKAALKRLSLTETSRQLFLRSSSRRRIISTSSVEPWLGNCLRSRLPKHVLPVYSPAKQKG